MVILLPLIAILLGIVGFWAGWLIGRRKKEVGVGNGHQGPQGPGPDMLQEDHHVDLPLQEPVAVHQGGDDHLQVPRVPGAWVD